MKVSSEHKSVIAFVQFCIDDERDTFDHNDLLCLSYALKTSPSKVRVELEGFGLSLQIRAPIRHVRGFTTSSNDRWYGPGSLPTYGGAGIDTSTGRATVLGKTV